VSVAGLTEADRLSFLGSVFDLRGASALVTGAGSGIGAAIAAALARAGARVVLADVDLAAATDGCERLRAAGATAEPARVDVGDREQVSAGLDLAERTHGPVDVVFANAGISGGRGPLYGGRIEDVTAQQWDATLRVNLTGVFHTVAETARRMRGRGGRIVVTASIAGLRGDTMVGYPYVASKAAVINLVRQAALDLADDGVLVNAIVPGPFRTNIGTRDTAVKAVMDKEFATTVPLGRVADTDEMRGVALFLASPAASFVTGTTFTVDGGSLAGRY
jgi:NAD(P)-dependent dehydrogenase (short-subunit alcohol dehydrogenase family)